MDAEMIERLERIEAGQGRIEACLVRLLSREPAKEWYAVPETAALIGRSVDCVRKWCASGRMAARKRAGGRSEFGEWEVSREEIDRYRNHGLLPPRARPAGAATRWPA